MLHFHKFRQELFDPQPARDVYVKRGPGKGWPEECPPIRAGNAFGFDLLANFDLVFVQEHGHWRVQRDIVLQSDFAYATGEEEPGHPIAQQYAWFWQKGQKLPHEISDNVYRKIRNQVKVSTFLYLNTDPNEMLLMTDVPNHQRPWRAMTALIEPDWYPASYPWHCVLELDNREKRIRIKKGDSICRMIPVRRDTYFARPMSPEKFDDFFARGQRWLATHGRFEHENAATDAGLADITHTYVRQQARAKFIVSL